MSGAFSRSIEGFSKGYYQVADEKRRKEEQDWSRGVQERQLGMQERQLGMQEGMYTINKRSAELGIKHQEITNKLNQMSLEIQESFTKANMTPQHYAAYDQLVKQGGASEEASQGIISQFKNNPQMRMMFGIEDEEGFNNFETIYKNMTKMTREAQSLDKRLKEAQIQNYTQKREGASQNQVMQIGGKIFLINKNTGAITMVYEDSVSKDVNLESGRKIMSNILSKETSLYIPPEKIPRFEEIQRNLYRGSYTEEDAVDLASIMHINMGESNKDNLSQAGQNQKEEHQKKADALRGMIKEGKNQAEGIKKDIKFKEEEIKKPKRFLYDSNTMLGL